MSGNRIKSPPVQPKEKPAPKRRKKNSWFVNMLNRFLRMFGILDRNQVVNWMPFILFITALVIAYIANSYYAERIIREIDLTKKELKERRAEYISTMSSLMYQSGQSEIAKSLGPYDIKESTTPPGKIFTGKEKEKKK